MSERRGYSSAVLKLLEKYKADLFQEVNIKLVDHREINGIILPRPLYGDPDVLVLKLPNGYNIGIEYKKIKDIAVISPAKRKPLVEPAFPHLREDLPLVYMLSTGGTIASRIDYSTGAVYPFFTAEEIYSMVPELLDLAYIKAETVYSIFSEDMTPKRWDELAKRIYEVYRKEAPAGIIVAHGTDTMGYTAAAIAFAVRNLPGPVIFVGSQRSSDRPSSDTALNVICAVKTAVEAPFGESVVVMHGCTSDDYCLAHRGVKVRKMHTSRRDAFRSVNDIPLALIRPQQRIKLLTSRYLKRSEKEPQLLGGFEEKVALIKFYPGMHPEILEFLHEEGYKGIVIEATGLGHVSEKLLEPIRKMVKDGIPIVITSQCIWGRVNLNVYRRGVELIKAGALPGEDMLPETAFVKLSWVLKRADDIESVYKMMLTNYVYEINPRSEERFYPPVWR
ncbi:MAG: Glu-tRNA(Gln) amidotransferase subunit GatD [Thermoproteales archaeon]|nr:Glu-tRNA(Gln) amidotransferase subunit GatD [Thermoproteales archaeon]